MTTVDILLVLAFGPIVLGLVVPFAVAALFILATEAREAYSARGEARRAPESPYANPNTARLVAEALAYPHDWSDELDTLAESVWRESKGDTDRMFHVDTQGICTVIEAAHRFAREPVTEQYFSYPEAYLSAIEDDASQWPNLDTTEQGQVLHAKRVLAHT